ncbi:MAG: TldD/PmbA family protein [Lachnospiraceae bacterium]|uniref:TldD/PmbA family protein n=1 Tax=Candidatus Weimeria bifida TaxID=2599074 RepID=A0A6N7IWX1_9FIRM|nr:TldD/PmbA family protein [Candidatus Weimeria bifida]RRF95663.1 MAG: TldD/PmbA family protein [Lachnospiraceae bacterium]
MKAPFSEYLKSIAPGLKELIGLLRNDYDYVSALATDSKGLLIRVSQGNKTVEGKTLTTERGIVVRVHNEDHYGEYALNRFDPADPASSYKLIRDAFEKEEELLKTTGSRMYKTGKLSDEPCTLFKEMETEEIPETCDVSKLIDFMTKLSDRGMTLSDEAVDVRVTAQSTHISKMFLSENRDLRQSYVYSEGTVIPIVAADGKTNFGYSGVSDLCGPEIFKGLEGCVDAGMKQALDSLHAEPVKPGEYTIITSPEVTGLIAHEAFGHGVEMDQFVKGRALGAQYIGKRVGSDLVTMHEGALIARDVTSYAFDDEGVLAGDVTEIKNGILKTGICDALAALRLGIKPTGNGKRENFEHKVYTRMTNTMFDSGTSKVDDMIKSVDYGFLLEGMESGMEDPKHWGIQCIVKLGREIKDGKLTGKVVSPVIMTGYVPDLLGHISMISDDRECFGNGACGKGHKEWVKVSDGGPYLKTVGRLG